MISSIPCFEYWLLLHFTRTTKSFSNAAAVRKELKSEKYWPKYSKAHKGTFLTRLSQLETAIKNAEYALNEISNTNNPNPSTRVHELVTYLKEIKV